MKVTILYKKIFVNPIVWTTLGLFFCFWNKVSPESVPCFSSGCKLYQSGAEGPLFWFIGCIGFLVLFFCAVFKRPNLGRFCAGIGLTFDVCFFLIMALTVPCIDCIITGLLLALSYRSFFAISVLPKLGQEGCVLRRSCLLLVWSVLFVVNIWLLVRGFISPWPLNIEDTENFSTAVFFSPSCPACKKLVKSIPESKAQTIAWYPVIDAPSDIESIGMLQALFVDGVVPMSEAIDLASKAHSLSFFERISPQYLLLQFRLWVNSAHVLSFGGGRLPLLEFRGMPETLTPKVEHRNPNKFNDTMLPLELEVVGICGGKHSSPCED